MNSDKYTKLQGRGLFVFSDPAGAKAILALAYFLNKNAFLEDYLIVSDRSYSFFKDFELNVETSQQFHEANIVKVFKPDFIFTGTSYTSKIELQFVEQGYIHSIRTYSFIDHWVNFYSRFMYNDTVIFPDEIWVIDDNAKQKAIGEKIPQEKLKIIGNPYYEYLSSWQPLLSRNDFLGLLELPEDNEYILYVPEPLSQVGGKEKFGFDEFDVLDEIITEFSSKYLLSLQKKCLLIKPHPNHDINLFKKKIKSVEGVCINILDKDVSMNPLMFYADIVVGIFSNALIEGNIIGAKVARWLPKTCKLDIAGGEILNINIIQELNV